MSKTEVLRIDLPHVSFPTGANWPLDSRSDNYIWRTFDLWPTQMPQTKESMVSAGFRYLGISDHVQCVKCSLCLKDWERDDDPWKEHARWSQKCPLVLQRKGQAFVDTAIHELPPILPQDKSEIKPKNTRLVKSKPEGFKESVTSKDSRSLTDIAEENKKMKWARVCKICYKSPARTMIIPCGHFLACEHCSDSSVEKCLACRGPISRTIQVFEG
ncbi:hypothetical protein TCAL_08742 [Tigriopus californicus]|uniref:RING-type domain-containing protein n=1 Tax=Tigriopus californicus TaxID=6832 RepID=A0A553P7P9_TIGCA|nr:hypothetical protein TCAL_08742 [Tigriopus californicus]|eukprot:TCALIF_08742-PA protein Name:"Similar to th Apoptosis 1 inhibitor (Drosophila melanogaster)" AED:0.03 eAED:0.03 QI:0/-1/0/1/-1/1/1/0/214